VQFEEAGPGDEGAFRPGLVGARRRSSRLAAVRTGRRSSGHRRGVLDPLFEEPDGEIACQLHGPAFELVEDGDGGVRVRWEETLEDGVGVLLPLLTKRLTIGETGHGHLEGQNQGTEVC
jgi:hypothetical protein